MHDAYDDDLKAIEYLELSIYTVKISDAKIFLMHVLLKALLFLFKELVENQCLAGSSDPTLALYPMVD